MSPARRRLVVIFVTAAIAAVVPGCTSAKVEGEGRLETKGRVLLIRDSKPSTVEGSRSLELGDVIEAEQEAKVTLPGGDVLELRPQTVLVMANGPDLRSGNLLVTAPGAPRAVRATGGQVEAFGTTRIDASLALRVVAYGGRAVLRSGGRTLDIPALREASVVGGEIRGPRALAIGQAVKDPTNPDGSAVVDSWDVRFLGEAVTRQADLESLASGFANQVATANARSVAYYRSILPGLSRESAFRQVDVDRLGRPAADNAQGAGAARFRAGDVLVGAAIALQGKRSTFANRMNLVTDFRSQGASWSLVALDQQVPVDGLKRLVDDAVNGAPLELAAAASRNAPAVLPEPPPARSTATTRAPAARSTPTTNTTRPTTTTTTPASRQAQPQTPPQTPPPVVLPVDPLLDLVVDPVANLLNNLLGTPRPSR